MHFLCLHLYQRYCQKMPSLPLLSDQSPNQIELTASPEQKEEEEEKTDRKVLQPSFPKWRKLESNRT